MLSRRAFTKTISALTCAAVSNPVLGYGSKSSLSQDIDGAIPLFKRLKGERFYEAVDLMAEDILEKYNYDASTIHKLVQQTRKEKEESYGLKPTERNSNLTVTLKNNVKDGFGVKDKLADVISAAQDYLNEHGSAVSPRDIAVSICTSQGYFSKKKPQEHIWAKAYPKKGKMNLFEDGFRNPLLIRNFPELYTSLVIHEFTHILDDHERVNPKLADMKDLYERVSNICNEGLKKNPGRLSDKEFLAWEKKYITDPRKELLNFQKNNPILSEHFLKPEDILDLCENRVFDELKALTLTEMRAYESELAYFSSVQDSLKARNKEPYLRSALKATLANFIIEYSNLKMNYLGQ